MNPTTSGPSGWVGGWGCMRAVGALAAGGNALQSSCRREVDRIGPAGIELGSAGTAARAGERTLASRVRGGEARGRWLAAAEQLGPAATKHRRGGPAATKHRRGAAGSGEMVGAHRAGGGDNRARGRTEGGRPNAIDEWGAPTI
jgi:hypothetical protein